MPDPQMPAVPGVTRLSPMAHRGSSSVYQGYQERFDRWVAVKVIALDPGTELDAAARRRFERECAVTGRMSHHPYVVGILDCGILDDGRPFLVTELCERGSLADRIAADGPLPAADVLAVGAKIAVALRDTHREGIIHRDIKPANILVRASGDPALADFGLSVRTSVDASRGLDAFSPAYAPPEALAEGEQSAAGDVYSLGSTLYTMLSGRPPVPVVAGEAPLTYLRRVVEDPIAPIDRADVPPELAETVLALMARRPEDRPTAEHVALRLERLGDRTRGPGAAVAAQPSLEDTSWRRDLASETWVRPGEAPRRSRFRTPPFTPRHLRKAAVVAAAVAATGAVATAALAYGPSLPLTGSPGGDTPATSTPATSAPPSRPPSAKPTKQPTKEPAVPAGFREVHGPEGLMVAVPDGWRVGPAAQAHVLKATDPRDPERFVLLGGEKNQGGTQLDRVYDLADEIDDYHPQTLRQVRFGDAREAVDWEFEFSVDGRALTAHGLYWCIDGREYTAYTRAPVEDEEEMEATFDAMVETARPR